MKYISLAAFEDISSALNFESDGTRIVGGCDLYTTKAAGSDKKLYKTIDKSLEAQNESLLRLAASLSPPQAKEFARSSNLSRSSPFGSLSQTSNRRKYAHMVATLNASHPDYDFSNVLTPSDFHRERRLNDVMKNVDAKLYSAQSTRVPRGLQTPGGSIMWGPRMWKMMDDEMNLYSCDVYSFTPTENPFDDEETALWSMHYFFFNKQLKRVAYLYARALGPTFVDQDSASEASASGALPGASTPARPLKRSRKSADFSARKRARFWLGDRADDLEDQWAQEGEVEDDESDDDEADMDMLEDERYRSRSVSSNMASSPNEPDKAEEIVSKGKEKVRTMEEDVAAAIEL